MRDIENLNIEEKKALEELQIRVKHDLPPSLSQDHTIFYRFLKARDFDVDKAEKMLRKHMEWRQVFQVDNILKTFKPKEVFLKRTEPNIFGYDKEENLVVYVPVGKMDSRDYLKAIKTNDLFMHIIWFSEKVLATMKEYNERTGGNANRVVLIYDLDELTLANTTCKTSIELVLGLAHISQDNYPERLRTVYTINAPSYYVPFFAILKPALSKLMLEKFKPFGHSGWKKHLLETIDADILPAFLGGTLTDPDGNPRCRTFVRQGGKIPPMYYLSHEERYFENKDKVKRALIHPMDTKEIYIDVTETGSRIQWKFLVKGKDIGFGLSLQISEQDVKELIPVYRYSTADGTEEGSYKCQSIGTYIATFDNSYSWLSSKEVEYHMIVINED